MKMVTWSHDVTGMTRLDHAGLVFVILVSWVGGNSLLSDTQDEL